MTFCSVLGILGDADGACSSSCRPPSLEEVDQRRQAARLPWHRHAWDVMYTALADPRPAAVIAVKPGVSVAFVHRATSRYRRLGLDHFLGGVICLIILELTLVLFLLSVFGIWKPYLV